MYNYKIKTSFASPEMPKARANKLVLLLKFYIRRKLDKIHAFSVWLRTGTKPLVSINISNSYLQ